MPKVLTAASTIKCAHQGTVTAKPSQALLQVDGQPVLVLGDLDGAPITDCKVPTASGSAPCTAVVSMLSGAATRMQVGGKAVLLETAAGLTNGLPTPGNLWNVESAGQTKLEAV